EKLSSLASSLTCTLKFAQRKKGNDACRIGLFVEDNFIHASEHMLERLQIHAAARNVRRLFVFLIHFQKTLRAALRFGDGLLAVTLRILKDLLRMAASFRNDAIGIGLRLIAGSLLIGACRLNVAESRYDVGGRVHLLQIDLSHLNAGIVAIECALNERLHGLLDLLAAFCQDGLNVVLTDNFAH